MSRPLCLCCRSRSFANPRGSLHSSTAFRASRCVSRSLLFSALNVVARCRGCLFAGCLFFRRPRGCLPRRIRCRRGHPPSCAWIAASSPVWKASSACRSSSSTIASGSSISSGSGSTRPPALTSMRLCLSWSAPLLVRRSSVGRRCAGWGGLRLCTRGVCLCHRSHSVVLLCRRQLCLPFEGLCTLFAASACLCRRAR
jgi:hypothetical protein